MSQTQTLQIPEQTVDVLTEPLTYEQYEADRDEKGCITRVVSVDYRALADGDEEAARELLAEAVVSELGEDWELHAHRVVAADPRHIDDPATAGAFLLVRVTMFPGYND